MPPLVAEAQQIEPEHDDEPEHDFQIWLHGLAGAGSTELAEVLTLPAP